MLTIAFEGVAEVDGVATDWGITLATVDADGSVTHLSGRTTDGEGELIVDGETWTDAYLGVIPLGDFDDGNAAYTWSAAVVEEEEDTDTGEPAVAEDAPGEEKAAACGCAGAGAPVGMAWIVGLGVAVARSRRRGPAYP